MYYYIEQIIGFIKPNVESHIVVATEINVVTFNNQVDCNNSFNEKLQEHLLYNELYLKYIFKEGDDRCIKYHPINKEQYDEFSKTLNKIKSITNGKKSSNQTS